ncbi:PAS domain-containing sensor histidine kinase [Priestia taiwanensis]|uniref:histidine kinase n=1 Tax=Priestia taiwanensis TaxID=1347902 RepID=A0A917EPW1_9BACI|nr:PAS domain-containing sensor histidine kinase [Priestia taiwanensis]
MHKKTDSSPLEIEEVYNDATTLTMDFCSSNGIAALEKECGKIFDPIPHHVVFLNTDGIVTLCNKKMVEDMNTERNAVIGQHIKDILQLPEHKVLALETISTGKEFRNETVLDNHYGIINTHIIRDEHGNMLRVIYTLQFLNTERDAERFALAGRIAAGIAHEIRNPLTTVRGYLQFLQAQVAEDIQHLFQSLLIPELDRANSIICDFLSITKTQSIQAEDVSINCFIQDYIKPLLLSEAHLNNIQIEYILAPELHNCRVESNKNQLIQVFLNLLQNAKDAAGDKPLHIIVQSMLENDHAKITFSDNGIGIPESIVSYIFDPFFTTKDTGTGLGLSLTRNIIHNHRGTIKATSSCEGTTFVIELPIIIDETGTHS